MRWGHVMHPSAPLIWLWLTRDPGRAKTLPLWGYIGKAFCPRNPPGRHRAKLSPISSGLGGPMGFLRALAARWDFSGPGPADPGSGAGIEARSLAGLGIARA